MSTPRTPSSRPKLTRERAIEVAKKACDLTGKPLPDFFVLAVRGYYSETIAPAGNNIGEYDDAVIVVGPEHFSTWNANTDPSRYGWNPNADKYMARLKPGVYDFKRLKHRGRYMAYGQAGDVTVERLRENRTIAQTETDDGFGIHLHLGGRFGTSSEGCLTIPPPQWEDFDDNLSSLILPRGNRFKLILVDGPVN